MAQSSPVVVKRKGCPASVPGRESSARFARRPSVTRRPFAFLSVAVVMACLFPGLSAQAQEPLALGGLGNLGFVSERPASVTLPAATGGTPPYTYSLTRGGNPALLYGMSFNPDTRVLSTVVPDHTEWAFVDECWRSVPCFESEVDYTVTDDIGTTATRKVIFIVLDFPPGFLPAPDDLNFTPGTAITPVTLPETAGNSAEYAYALTGPNGADLSEVPGLTFDPATRVLSGAPTEEGTTTVTYTATHTRFIPTFVHTHTFAITVGELALPAQDDLAYPVGTAIDPVTLPAATGGTAPHTYALTGPNGGEVSEAVPGLTFDPATRVLSGTPTEGGATTLTYTVTDSATTPASVTRTFTVTVAELALPEQDDLAYPVGAAIDPVTLPAATGGTAPHTYALTGPNGGEVSEAVPGLTFDPATRVLSGTPTEGGATTLTYTVTDSATTPASVTRTFTVTVTVTVGSIPAALNEVLLPEVARAMADSAVGAIARRIGQAARGGAGPEATGFSLGGQDGWAAALRTHGEAVSEGRRDFKELLAGSDFVLPLNAAPTGAVGVSSVAFWGSGEYRDLSGESGTLDWDGDLAGVHLGVDARPREDLLAGVAVSWLESDLDYEDAAPDGGLDEGTHVVELTGVHPYLGWRAGERLDVWATAGYGEGELEVTPKGEETRSSDIETRTVGVGGNGLLLERGARTVRLKGEVMHSTVEVDDSAHIEGLEVEATRVRMTVEAGQTHALANGGVFEPSLEVGVRHDGGDGETGSGAEVGGRLSYRHPARGITAEGRVHALVAGHGDHKEWGVEGHLDLSPGAGGRGLSLRLRPGYGDRGGDGVRQLWRQGVPEDGDHRAEDYRARLEARLGYGLFLPGYAGVFTPYTGMTVGATGGYRIGVSWKAGSRFNLDLRGERREPGGGPAEHALVLQGEVRF